MAAKRKPDIEQLNAARAASTAATRTFESPSEFRRITDAYFDECDARGEVYGEASMALYLSAHNSRGRIVTLERLREWYDGNRGQSCFEGEGEDKVTLQDVVQQAYMRIQSQIETDPRYQEKGGMTTRAIFLQKQKRFGGYQDKLEQKTETVVKVIHGDTLDESDFA